MSTSTLLNISEPVIKVDGTAIDPVVNSALIECVVDLAVNAPAMVTLLFDDPELELTNATTYQLGKTLEILRGTVSLAQVEITSIEPEVSAVGRSTLLVRGLHKAHRLHYSRRTKTFQDVTDSDMISSACSAAGLSATVASSTASYKHVIQWNQTDMEFVLERARRYGVLMICNGANIKFAKPADAVNVAELMFGSDFDQCSIRATTGAQIGNVEMSSWDPASKAALVSSGKTPAAQRAIGDSALAASSKLKTDFGTHTTRFFEASPADQSSLDTALQAYVDQIGEELVEMDANCMGKASLVAGAKVTISNIGTRFSGVYHLTTVRHTFSPMGYETQIQAASYQPMTVADLVGSESKRQRIEGVVVGLVTNVNEDSATDSAKWSRVRVKFPYMSTDDESWWARVATPMAGAGRGFQFVPEVDDEVLVAFENGDPNRPYVIGSLWSGKDSRPLTDAIANGKVEKRIIKTRVGHMVQFNDKSGEEEILIQDKGGNYVKLHAASGSEKVTIYSAKDIDILATAGKVFIDAKDYEVKASGTIKQTSTGTSDYKATGNMTINSSLNAKVAGSVNAELSAGVAVKVAGSASGEVNGGAMLTLGGALIKIG